MTRSSLAKLAVVALLAAFLNCAVGAQAQQQHLSRDETQAKHILQRYIELRLQDADWKEYSKFITWPEEPGWDCKWLVNGYSVHTPIKRSGVITIPVISDRLALFCSDFYFKLDLKSVTIKYELIRDSQNWKVNGPIPDYPEIGTKALLKLLRRVAGSDQEERERRADAVSAARKIQAALTQRNLRQQH